MSILQLLGFSSTDANGAGAQTDTVREIVEQLSHMDQEQARYIAAFAYLLSRVASADLRVSKEETRAMEAIVAEHGGLPAEQSGLVVRMAQSRNQLFGSTEDFLVTREFRDIATRAQKLALLDCLYAVCASEGLISVVEDNEVRKISSELLLEHRDVIAVRSRYRDYLAVLRPSGSSSGENG